MELLWPHQLEHCESMVRVLRTHRCAIDPSDTGTGKTICGVAVCDELALKPFIICPKAVIENWFKTLAMFDLPYYYVSNYEMAKLGKGYLSLLDYQNGITSNITLYRCKGDDVYRWDNVPADLCVIIDEAHKGKNPTANAKFLKSTIVAPKSIILSATITDEVKCFHLAAYLLGLAQSSKIAYKAWLKRISADYTNQAEAIHHVLYPEYGHRMRVRDLKLSDDDFTRNLFLDNDICAALYEVSPEIEEALTTEYALIDAAMNDLKEKQITAACFLTIRLRARQRIEMLKVGTMISLIREYLDKNYSVCVFLNFNDSINAVIDGISDIPVLISKIVGGQSATVRSSEIMNFQNDLAHVAIVNTRAGGVGISLHSLPDRRPRAAFISCSESSIDLKQVIGRIYRAGMSSNAFQRIVYCRGPISDAGKGAGADCTFNKKSIEELIADNQNRKLKNIEWFNNGDEIELIKL